MDSHRSQQLAFLISLGMIPLACNGDDGTTDASAGATTTAGSDSDTGTETTGETTSATGLTTTDPTTTGPTTTDATTTDPTATDGDTMTTGTPDGICEGYAAKYPECYDEGYREALADCEETLSQAALFGGLECAGAYEALFSCYGGLECSAFDDPEACAAEYEAVDVACLPEPGPTCLAFGAKVAECDGSDASEEATDCQALINFVSLDSEACGDAFEEYYACLANLDCADFDDPEACAKESASIDEVCG